MQITLAVMAMLGALALGLRFLRRGEELVLEDPAAGRSDFIRAWKADPHARPASRP